MTAVADMLKDIKYGGLVLPEFQRGYVWTSSKIRAYIRSLYKKYPTGHFLIWKTTDLQKSRGDSPDTESKFKELILDGQQRLTTLYVLFEGKPPPFFEGKELYFKLYFNIVEEEFEFWQPVKMRDNPAWMEITPFLKKGLHSFLGELNTLPEELRNLYMNYLPRLTALDAIRNYEYTLDVVPKGGLDMSVEEVVQVFNLVNSSGVPLNKADLALAHITSFWPEAREELKDFYLELKKTGFDFKIGKGRELELFVRCIAGVAIGSILLEGPFYKTPIELIRASWVKVKEILEYLINFLRNDAYVDSSDNLTTFYVLIPMVVYLAKNHRHFANEDEKSRFLYWFYAAQLRGRYSGSMESALQADLNVLDQHDPASRLVDNLLAQSGRIDVEPKELAGKGVNSTFYNMTYIVARSLGAEDWFRGISLYSRNIGKPNRLESHHIFPKSKLYNEGGYSGNDADAKKTVNEIANRAFLTQKANLKTGTDLPSQYLSVVQETYPGSLVAQFVPIDSEIWELERYEDFLVERRKLIAQSINDFLNNLKDGKAEDAPKLRDVHYLLRQGESETVEFKSSIRWDYNRGEVNKDLGDAIVKAVAAFLNTRGGTIIIGIADDGSVLGLKRDYDSLPKSNRDGFELHLQQTISKKIGVDRFKLNVSVTPHEVNGNDIWSVHVEPSPRPVYIEEGNQSILYIRVGPSSRALNTREAIAYVQEHWQS